MDRISRVKQGSDGKQTAAGKARIFDLLREEAEITRQHRRRNLRLIADRRVVSNTDPVRKLTDTGSANSDQVRKAANHGYGLQFFFLVLAALCALAGVAYAFSDRIVIWFPYAEPQLNAFVATIDKWKQTSGL